MSDHVANLLHRAGILRETRRDEEAIALLLEALASDPEDPEIHVELALARMEVKGQRRLAVESIDEAIRIQADNPYFLALKGHILVQLDKDKEGINFAEQAIALEPSYEFSWVVKAAGLMGLNRWEDAEVAARTALSLDPDCSDAANLLANILRAQGKLEDSEIQVESLLQQDPEDPFAHASNGWNALQQGDAKKAEEFFSESLRIDPENEYAKEGIKEAYKSRSWFYRIFLKWVFFMQRYTEGKQFAIAIGLYITFRIVSGLAGGSDSRLGMGILGIWITIVCWSILAPAIGNFILLKDSRARHALKGWEKRSGLLVGLPFLLGVGIVLIGLMLLNSTVPPQPGKLAFSGGALIFCCFPSARVFGNASLIGKSVFGFLGILAFVGFLITFAQSFTPKSEVKSGAELIASLGYAGAILSTWLSLIPGIYRPIDPMDE